MFFRISDTWKSILRDGLAPSHAEANTIDYTSKKSIDGLFRNTSEIPDRRVNDERVARHSTETKNNDDSGRTEIIATNRNYFSFKPELQFRVIKEAIGITKPDTFNSGEGERLSYVWPHIFPSDHTLELPLSNNLSASETRSFRQLLS